MMEKLAVEGGPPVRNQMLPYGRQHLDEADIAAVVEVLRSDWLTTGPMVGRFEEAFAAYVGAREAVAVSNGTAALHAAAHALGIGPGDEVIVPALTFAASANCVFYQGGTPVFVDVSPETLLLDPTQVEAALTARTKAVVAVDYTGHPCAYDALQDLATRHGLALISDACHALGGAYKGRSVGTLADLSTFSLHPVKHITTGEGGVITTDDASLAQKMRAFRNHGLTSDHRQRAATGSWFYEMVELGYNYRLTDFQAALGISQLQKLPQWIARRTEIAQRYDEAFVEQPGIQPLGVRPDVVHAYHLYVVQLDLERLCADRAQVFAALRAENIGVNVHYIPVPWHPYYQQRGYGRGHWAVAEAAYARILSLPLFPMMSDQDVEDVIVACRKVLRAHYK